MIPWCRFKACFFCFICISYALCVCVCVFQKMKRRDLTLASFRTASFKVWTKLALIWKPSQSFSMRLVPSLTTAAMLKPFSTSWWLVECWVGGSRLTQLLHFELQTPTYSIWSINVTDALNFIKFVVSWDWRENAINYADDYYYSDLWISLMRWPGIQMLFKTSISS